MGQGEDEVIREVDTFCYHGDVIEGIGQLRVAAAWAKKREISGLLHYQLILFKNRDAIFDACIQSVMVYGEETCALAQQIEKCFQSRDRRMCCNTL